MMERLNTHIVAQSEDISALELPFIIFEELQTDFEKRYQIYKNLVRTNVLVNYHLFTKQFSGTDLTNKFESMIYDKIFWKNVVVFFSSEGKSYILEERAGEFWEHYTYRLEYRYTTTLEHFIEAGVFNKVDMTINGVQISEEALTE